MLLERRQLLLQDVVVDDVGELAQGHCPVAEQPLATRAQQLALAAAHRATRLGLEPGKEAWVIVKASDVMVGVSD